MFAMFFIVFAYSRSTDVALYSRSRDALNQWLGVSNTLLMLTSSWLVALAVHAARRSLARSSARLMGLAFLCGLSFAIVKGIEYTRMIRTGITLETNDFFMYYFLFTGIHLIHVLIGVGVLLYLRKVVLSANGAPKRIAVMESGASFWHMVDMLWIILFALLYLMP